WFWHLVNKKGIPSFLGIEKIIYRIICFQNFHKLCCFQRLHIKFLEKPVFWTGKDEGSVDFKPWHAQMLDYEWHEPIMVLNDLDWRVIGLFLFSPCTGFHLKSITFTYSLSFMWILFGQGNGEGITLSDITLFKYKGYTESKALEILWKSKCAAVFILNLQGVKISRSPLMTILLGFSFLIL
ncbi:hypothetical protein ACJX0J_011027, partial [Zea mays]